MLQKKTILHFIYNLGRGGAETMLVSVLKELKEFDNIVVVLQFENSFVGELECKELICLDCPSLYDLPSAVFKLKRIIKQHYVDLVHSHLPQSNFIARLATPNSVPLINTIHTSVSVSSDYKKWFIRALDRLTYRYRKVKILAVSQKALDDYFNLLKVKKVDADILYTFVDPRKYQKKMDDKNNQTLKIVSVGSLRDVKNYGFLLQSIRMYPSYNWEMHIYGEGPLKENLADTISLHNLPVVLKGQVNNIADMLRNYNLYVMASKYEGFSLSVLEAMATGLPLLLSDIPSFREQCGDAAIYFQLDNPDDFTNKLKLFLHDPKMMESLSEKAFKRVMNNYTLEHHLVKLKEIYQLCN